MNDGARESCVGEILQWDFLSESTHLVQVFLSLLFVLHVADARRQVPEADVGVLRLRGHTDDKISEE